MFTQYNLLPHNLFYTPVFIRDSYSCIPFSLSYKWQLNELQYNLQKEYSILTPFLNKKVEVKPTGFGIIVPVNELLVIDVDNAYQLKVLKAHNIFEKCKFYIKNDNSSYSFVFKMPTELVGLKRRRMLLDKTSFFLLGLWENYSNSERKFGWNNSDVITITGTYNRSKEFKGVKYNYLEHKISTVVGSFEELDYPPNSVTQAILQTGERIKSYEI